MEMMTLKRCVLPVLIQLLKRNLPPVINNSARNATVINAKDRFGATPLHLAMESTHVQTVKILRGSRSQVAQASAQ